MNIALRVPDSLGIRLKEFAKHESISMNQFIVFDTTLFGGRVVHFTTL